MSDPLRLNLGCGTHPMEGWLNVDYIPSRPEGDVLPRCGFVAPSLNVNLDYPFLRLPWDDDTVDEIRGSHVIEHITNVLPLMQELYRVAKPDTHAYFACPYGSSDDAWENPTHVRPMFVGSWGFFGQPNYWRESYSYTADWVVEEIRLRVAQSVWDRVTAKGRGDEAKIRVLYECVGRYRNVVAEQVVTLRANKPARARDRTLQEDKRIVFEVLEPINGWESTAREVGTIVMGMET